MPAVQDLTTLQQDFGSFGYLSISRIIECMYDAKQSTFYLMLLEQKVILITGGEDEIAKATARAAITAGARVVYSSSREEDSEFVDTLVQAGGVAIFHHVNVMSRSDLVEASIERVVEEFGRLDLVFNNFVEVGKRGFLNQMEEQETFDLIDTNVFGTWVAMKYEIEQMLKNQGGAIVNNCSILGKNPLPAHSVCSATHHAIVAMTKASAVEYARFNIRINAISPGFIATSKTENINVNGSNGNRQLESSAVFVPMERLGQPEEVAKAVVWLCSEEPSFTTGHIFDVSGCFI